MGIAGTPNDFLLSIPTLKSYAMQDDEISRSTDIGVAQYGHVARKDRKESCKRIVREIAEFAPDLVGFSVYVWNLSTVLTLCEMVREALSGVKIVLGGPEVATGDVSQERFNERHVDYLVPGEGEKAFSALIKYFLRSGATDIRKVPGIFLKQDKWAPAARPAEMIEDLTKAPSPYLNGTISRDFLSRPSLRANIETQRGCNLRCAYCMYHKNFPSIRYRDGETVISEIEYIHSCSIEKFRFTDANFFSDKAFALGVLRGMIEKRIEMSMFVEVIPYYLDQDVAEILGEYQALSPKNSVIVGLGLQSINNKSLKSIRRNFDVKHFDQAYDALIRANAIIKTDIILGLPYETFETYCGLIEYIVEKMRLGNNFVSLALLRILPGSELEDIAIKEKLVLDDRDDGHFVYETPHMSRPEMVACLRMNAVTYRILNTLDIESRMALRNRYFQVKDSLNVPHLEMIERFVAFFMETLEETDSDFAKDDFPNAEDYCSAPVFTEISDAAIINKLSELTSTGAGKEVARHA